MLSSSHFDHLNLTTSLPLAQKGSNTCTVILSDNMLSGTLPSTLFNPATSVGTSKILYLNNNRIQGSIVPAIFAPCERASIVLRITNNSLSGAIPSGMFSFCLPKSIYIEATQNRLSGSLPSSLFAVNNLYNFTSLTPIITIIVSDNLLTGSIPAGLFTRADVATVNLIADNNLLSGPLPSGLFQQTSTYYKMSLLLSFSNNAINGSIPEEFLISPTTFSSFSVSLDSNKLSKNLPADICSNLDAADLKLNFANNLLGGDEMIASTFSLCSSSTFSINLNNNLLNGTLPNAFFLGSNIQTSTWFFSSNSIDFWPSPNTVPATFNLRSIDLSYNNLSLIPGDMELSSMRKLTFLNLASNLLIGALGRPVPDLPVFGLGGSYNFSNCSFSGPLPKVNVSKCPGSLSLGSNSLAGPIPSSWVSCAVDGNPGGVFLHLINVTNLKDLTGDVSLLLAGTFPPSLVARNTSLSGIMPELPTIAVGFQQDAYRLDISSSFIDFCSSISTSRRQPWVPSPYIPNCILRDTTACDCPELWPQCEVSCSCPPSSRPSADFFCIDGVWTSPSSVDTPELVIPPGSTTTVISGNLTSPSVVFQSSGSTLIIKGCANISQVVLTMTTGDIEKLTHGEKKKIQQLLLSEASCGNLSAASLVVQGLSSSGCKKIKSEKAKSEAFALSAVFTVDSSSCNVWWIIVVSIVGVLLVVGIVTTTIVVSKWKAGAYSKNITD